MLAFRSFLHAALLLHFLPATVHAVLPGSGLQLRIHDAGVYQMK
jgi:hypothetical protein